METVWVSEQADLTVYLYDENTDGPLDFITGNGPDVDPILTYCYLRQASCQAAAAFTRRAVTGRGRRKIVRRSGSYDEVSVSSAHFCFKKSESWRPEDIFNAWTPLYLVFKLTDFPIGSEQYVVKRVFTPTFDIQFDDGSEVIASVTFIGEALV